MNALPSPTPKQARAIWFALTGLAVAAVIALIVAGVWGLGRVLDLLSPVLWPLAIAAVAACLLSPVVDFFERRKLSRVWAILLVFFMALMLVLGVLASVIPQVVVETEQLASKVPDYSKSLQKRLQKFIAGAGGVVAVQGVQAKTHMAHDLGARRLEVDRQLHLVGPTRLELDPKVFAQIPADQGHQGRLDRRLHRRTVQALHQRQDRTRLSAHA